MPYKVTTHLIVLGSAGSIPSVNQSVRVSISFPGQIAVGVRSSSSAPQRKGSDKGSYWLFAKGSAWMRALTFLFVVWQMICACGCMANRFFLECFCIKMSRFHEVCSGVPGIHKKCKYVLTLTVRINDFKWGCSIYLWLQFLVLFVVLSWIRVLGRRARGFAQTFILQHFSANQIKIWLP